jgi:hypothetical protein
MDDDMDGAFSLLNLTPEDIAQSLTMIDYQIYDNIHFTELLRQSWNKESRRHQAPNVIRNINFLNRVSNWASVNILVEKNIKKRTLFMEKLIQVLKALKEINSFNMLMAISSSFSISSVHRLMDEVPPNLKTEIEVKHLIIIIISRQSKSF